MVEYETMLTTAISNELRSSLPTVKEIETELSNEQEVKKTRRKGKQ